jgi:MOSC domain-containing protein YiiM
VYPAAEGRSPDTIEAMATCHPPTVISVNISVGGIPKVAQPRADILPRGLAGDGHNHDKHNTPTQAVSLIDVEDLDDLRTEGFDVYPGATGENLTLRGLDIDRLCMGDRLRFTGGVELELTKARNPCYVMDAIDPELKKALIGRCGYLARVVHTGVIRPGEAIEVVRAGTDVEQAKLA